METVTARLWRHELHSLCMALNDVADALTRSETPEIAEILTGRSCDLFQLSEEIPEGEDAAVDLTSIEVDMMCAVFDSIMDAMGL